MSEDAATRAATTLMWCEECQKLTWQTYTDCEGDGGTSGPHLT